ncbi:hypothetical protein [Litorimonas sp. WD9-15]|uniref:hypothetical protein n=1 Tax=Litorimonas sp. WD9-15 TaxID=3418716 RepID=UPI003D04D9E5
MSLVKTWPSGLRGNGGQIRKDGFEPLPPANIRRSDMEDSTKQARKFTRGWSGVKGRWRFSLSEFATFETWVRDELKDGIHKWRFNHPLRSYDVAAGFVSQSNGRAFAVSAAPGANVFVTFELEFLDRALA